MRRRVSARSWLRVVSDTKLRSYMPTYLTPGVYVEEVPSANKPIEGVSTSVAAFVGLTPGGPVNTPMRGSNCWIVRVGEDGGAGSRPQAALPAAADGSVETFRAQALAAAEGPVEVE